MGSQLITYNGANAPVSAMGPADGDAPIAAGDVVPGLQAAGDIAWNALLRVQPLATLAALRAITTPADELTRYVLGYGMYTFKTTPGLLVDVEPWSVAAADATPGRWVHEEAKARAPGYRTAPLTDPYGITSIAVTWDDADRFLVNPIDAAGVTRRVSSSEFASSHTGANQALQMYFSLDRYLVNGTRISNAQITISPSGAHGTLPNLMPRFTIVRYATDPWVGTLENLLAAGYFSDGSSLGTFNTVHKFGGALDQNHNVDLAEYSYALIAANEGGTNSLGGMKLCAIELVLTP